MKRNRLPVAAILAALTVANATLLNNAALAALLGANTAIVACWAFRLLRLPGRTASQPARPRGAEPARSTGYTAAAVLAFARSTPALLVAVSDRPAGWLDGIAVRDRRTLATAGILHVDPKVGLTLTAAGYKLASQL